MARFRLPALVVTLGRWEIGNGLGYLVTGKGFVDHIPANIAAIGQGQVLGLPIPVIIFFAIVALSYFLLHRTPFGAEVYAVGGNPRAAFISGVPVRRVRIMVSQSPASSMALALSSTVELPQRDDGADDRP